MITHDNFIGKNEFHICENSIVKTSITLELVWKILPFPVWLLSPTTYPCLRVAKASMDDADI